MPRPKVVSDAALLDAVGRHVSAVGLRACTVASAAAAAGVSPATLVQRFGSFERCLHAMLERRAERLRQALSEGEDLAAGTGLERVIWRFASVWGDGDLAKITLSGLAWGPSDHHARRRRAVAAALEETLPGCPVSARLLDAVWIGAMATRTPEDGDLPGHVARCLRELWSATWPAGPHTSMEERDMVEAIQQTRELSVPPSRAFELFTLGLGEWWPRDYTWSQDRLERIFIEPRVGGRCVERSAGGPDRTWGTVVEAEPGVSLDFRWQIDPDRSPQPDPARASIVRVRFEPSEGGTRVELRHEELERHPGDPHAYREGLASPAGWPLMLDRLVGVADAPA